MHTAAEFKDKDIAKQALLYILVHSRALGMQRVSLETDAQAFSARRTDSTSPMALKPSSLLPYSRC
jgi:hypothetical protein